VRLVPRSAKSAYAAAAGRAGGRTGPESFPAHRSLVWRALTPPSRAGSSTLLLTALRRDALTERQWLASEGPEQAERALDDLLAHAEALSGLPLALEPALVARAVEDLVLASLFDAEVPSTPALRAWRRWKTEQPYGPVTSPRDAVSEAKRAAVRERVLRGDWARAWAVWASRMRAAGVA
jgi:hypothetical protein